MYDLGDELTIESYRIPWLIWIQLLVLFLLIFLLFCFNFFGSDPSNSSAPSSSSSSPSASGILTSHGPGLEKSVYKHTNSKKTTVIKRCLHTQGGENQSIKGEIATNIGRRIVKEDLDSSSSDTEFIDFHPCNYFKLAKLAFLKCLGLDHILENSSSSDRRKDR